MTARRPAIGVLCCNERIDRPVQVVATRFIDPLSRIAGATVLLVPAITDSSDLPAVAERLDGLLLTGSRSHVAPHRYGAEAVGDDTRLDEARDEVALRLAGHMIERGQPVFGICRGFQQINVLFGGSLSSEVCRGRHHRGADAGFDDQFAHCHAIDLVDHGVLATATGQRRAIVNSVHEQGVDRLGDGLRVEAVAADDGLIEAISARPCGGDVLAVQWHPEWDGASGGANRAFFDLIGRSLHATGTHLGRM
ncbi:gamma-glutamyl-gamma-aminobutyrate hydrolase family protein [Sphingomonas sp.]|uniref:gamma-glutamyl-gamma-aminobutyrate hydrolase family protein n=1 Tax=Sphingomonas sp. TaxID=28214 RepID=UPI002BC0BE7C|nr:gamma-glutamyl-gamma-aminobutyrate hydrolase family protein [Sphingomonas sp.]HWK36546.1 gamma-glutamyl-gamma-aminobutyrate hydrolase family protein [Sphingomonas sp.]